MEAWIVDVLDRPDAKDADFKGQTLVHNLAFRWAWHSLLGIHATKLDYYEFFCIHPTEVSLESVRSHIVQYTGLNVGIPGPVAADLQMKMDAYIQRISSESRYSRDQVLLKIWDRYVQQENIPESIFDELRELSLKNAHAKIVTQYSRAAQSLQGIDFTLEQLFRVTSTMMQKHRLLFHNPMNETINNPQAAERLAFVWHGLLCAEEAVRYCVTHDRQMMTDIASANVIHISDKDANVDEVLPLLEAADETSPKRIVVIVHSNTPIHPFQLADKSLVYLKVPSNINYIIRYLPHVASRFVSWKGSDNLTEHPPGLALGNGTNIAYFSRGNNNSTVHPIYDRIAISSVSYRTKERTDVCVEYIIPLASRNVSEQEIVDSCLGSSELVKTYWKSHLSIGCPLRAAARGDITISRAAGVLLFYQFIIVYVTKHRREIEQRCKESLGVARNDNRNGVVIIDNRPSMLSVLSLMITLSNLDKNTWTDVHVVCTKASEDFFKKWLPTKWQCNFHVLSSYPSTKFDVQRYSDLLKSPTLWSWLRPCKKCLLVQDDGMVVQKGVESYLKYDYVGAPWNKEAFGFMKGIVNDEFVGNGGLSLRDVDVMYSVCMNHEADVNELFASLPQRLPEDVFFSKYVAQDGHVICPRDHAEAFAVEQVINWKALGFHKCWPYHETALTCKLFETFCGCRLL
jgi:hypothetical protein